ncbi:MAG: hypothetical protein KDE51_27065, partial [Anaerolineales bacterium]|nr:hypothetical protein [Anaerolineales bacterium]
MIAPTTTALRSPVGSWDKPNLQNCSPRLHSLRCASLHTWRRGGFSGLRDRKGSQQLLLRPHSHSLGAVVVGALRFLDG